jgi:hypothetical protein
MGQILAHLTTIFCLNIGKIVGLYIGTHKKASPIVYVPVLTIGAPVDHFVSKYTEKGTQKKIVH